MCLSQLDDSLSGDVHVNASASATIYPCLSSALTVSNDRSISKLHSHPQCLKGPAVPEDHQVSLVAAIKLLLDFPDTPEFLLNRVGQTEQTARERVGTVVRGYELRVVSSLPRRSAQFIDIQRRRDRRAFFKTARNI